MPASTTSKSEPLSIYSIAEKTGYTPAGVHKALERLGIQPEFISPSGARYFSQLVIPILKEHMRTKPRNGDS